MFVDVLEDDETSNSESDSSYDPEIEELMIKCIKISRMSTKNYY